MLALAVKNESEPKCPSCHSDALYRYGKTKNRQAKVPLPDLRQAIRSRRSTQDDHQQAFLSGLWRGDECLHEGNKTDQVQVLTLPTL